MSDMSNVSLGNLVTVADAMKRLNVNSDSLIIRYIKEKKFRAQRFGGRVWMIDAASLEEFAAKPRKRGNPQFSKKTA
jgi:hypothetical protein